MRLVVVAFLVLVAAVAAGADGVRAQATMPAERLSRQWVDLGVDATRDASGRLHLATDRDGFGAGVWYHRQALDGSWLRERVSATDDITALALALGPADQPWIATSGPDRLELFTRTTGRWVAVAAPFTPRRSMRIALAVGNDGIRHVAWYEQGRLELRRSTLIGWERIAMPAPGLSKRVTIAVDRQGTAWVSYVRPGAEIVLVAVAPGARSGVVRHVAGKGRSPHLVLDADATPHLAWSDRRQQVWYAPRTDGTWVHELVRTVDAMDDYLGPSVAVSGRRVFVGWPAIPDTYAFDVGERVAAGHWKVVLRSQAHWDQPKVVPDQAGEPEIVFADGTAYPPREFGVLAARRVDGAVRNVQLVPARMDGEAALALAPDGRAEVVLGREGVGLFRAMAPDLSRQRRIVDAVSDGFDTGITPSGERLLAFERWDDADGELVIRSERDGAVRETILPAGLNPQIAIGPDGVRAVASLRWVRETDIRLQVDVRRAGRWQRFELPRPSWDSDNGWGLAITPDGVVHVAWMLFPGTYQEEHRAGVRMAHLSPAGDWTVERLTWSKFHSFGTIAVAPDGTLGVRIGDLAGPDRLMLIAPDGSRSRIEGPTGVGFTFDRESRPLVLTFAYGGPQRVVRWDGRAWQPTGLGIPNRVEVHELAVHGDRLSALGQRYVGDEYRPDDGWYLFRGRLPPG